MVLSKIVITLSKLIFLACVGPLYACAVPMCLGNGPEMAPSFTVALHREGKPLAGAKVTVAGAGKEHVVETGADGTFRFVALTPGEYTLDARYIGVILAWQCFHIREKPSPGARGSVSFPWAPLFQDLRMIQGTIFDPNKWLPPLRLELHEVSTRRTVAQAKVNAAGSYHFGSVPEGEYVLTIAGGVSASAIESKQLVRLNSASARLKLDLSAADTTCGTLLTIVR